jgi:tetratricopeptide (TPR) repeat protein
LAQARVHFEEGERLYAAGRWSEAYAAYEAAYQEAPLADFLFNMGQCERRLGHLERALTLFERFRETEPPQGRRAVVESLIRQLREGRDRDAVSADGAAAPVPAPARPGPRAPAAERSPIQPPSRPPSSPRRKTASPGAWALGGAAVALAGAAIFFAVRAESTAGELDDLGAECGRASVVGRCVELEDAASTLYLAQNVTSVLAGLAAAAALVVLTIDLRPAGGGGPVSGALSPAPGGFRATVRARW